MRAELVMTGVLDLLVDAYDRVIDSLRQLAGLPPLPPLLLKLEFEQRPTVRVPTGLRIEMRRTFHAFLRVEQDRNILFEGSPPRDGRVVIVPLSGALIRVHLEQESRYPTARHGRIVTETIVEPLANGPPLEVTAPATALFGGPLACGWHSPTAERVHLAAIEDAGITEYVGSPSGQILLHPTRPGSRALRLTAENQWGQTTIKRTVEVVVPKLRIALLSPTQLVGRPGQPVRIEWRAEGAREVWFVAPARGLTKKVTDEHALETWFGIEPEELRFIARALHSAEEHSATVTLLPSPFADFGMPD
jgi:hypothetical protein